MTPKSLKKRGLLGQTLSQAEHKLHWGSENKNKKYKNHHEKLTLTQMAVVSQKKAINVQLPGGIVTFLCDVIDSFLQELFINRENFENLCETHCEIVKG